MDCAITFGLKIADFDSRKALEMVGLKLGAMQFGIKATRRQEFGMFAPLHYSTLIDNQNFIRLPNRAQPVGDHQ